MNDKIPCIYILASKKNGTLYTGVTSNLQKRIYEHKSNAVKGFTQKYNRLLRKPLLLEFLKFRWKQFFRKKTYLDKVFREKGVYTKF